MLTPIDSGLRPGVHDLGQTRDREGRLQRSHAPVSLERAMHLKFFADSYEHVKKAVIHAIAEPKEWLVHLMLFRSIGGGPRGGGLIIAEYAAFLGLPEAAVLPRNDREKQHLVSDLGKRPSQHAFLDPDTVLSGTLQLLRDPP